MGVRTRGLDITAGAAKLKADKAARLEAELVIDRWNRRLATGRDMLWSPTIRAALIAGTPWLDVFCPGCGTSRAIDLRTGIIWRTKAYEQDAGLKFISSCLVTHTAWDDL
jgi:hypothetical protein